jgi:hypothetical protein
MNPTFLKEYILKTSSFSTANPANNKAKRAIGSGAQKPDFGDEGMLDKKEDRIQNCPCPSECEKEEWFVNHGRGTWYENAKSRSECRVGPV